MLAEGLPDDWKQELSAALASPSFQELERFVEAERREATVFPSEEDLFSAFRLTPYEDVRVLLLGQDPYHGPGQAHGLAFSVKPGVAPPPSPSRASPAHPIEHCSGRYHRRSRRAETVC